MFRKLFAAAAALLVASSAVADQRLFCAADGAALTLSLEIEFDETLGGRLAHFRGVATMKDAQVPPGLRHVTLASTMLTQQWADGKALRLRLYDAVETGRSTDALDLAVSAAGGDGAPYRGTYALAVFTKPLGAGARRAVVLRTSGEIACSAP